MFVVTRSEKSSQSRQINFATLQGEKNCEVCLMNVKEAK